MSDPGKHAHERKDIVEHRSESPSHAVDERTQSNWNGIVGRLELRATDPVWLDEVQVYPDVDKKQAAIRAVVGNITGQAASGRIEVSGRSWNVPTSVSFPA